MLGCSFERQVICQKRKPILFLTSSSVTPRSVPANSVQSALCNSHWEGNGPTFPTAGRGRNASARNEAARAPDAPRALYGDAGNSKAQIQVQEDYLLLFNLAISEHSF